MLASFHINKGTDSTLHGFFHYFYQGRFNIGCQSFQIRPGYHLSHQRGPTQLDNCLPSLGMDSIPTGHKKGDIGLFLKCLVGEPGIADFNDLQRSPLETFFSQGLLDVMNGQYPELMLGGYGFKVLNHRRKRFVSLQLVGYFIVHRFLRSNIR
jgi:hypothetical protein